MAAARIRSRGLAGYTGNRASTASEPCAAAGATRSTLSEPQRKQAGNATGVRHFSILSTGPGKPRRLTQSHSPKILVPHTTLADDLLSADFRRCNPDSCNVQDPERRLFRHRGLLFAQPCRACRYVLYCAVLWLFSHEGWVALDAILLPSLSAGGTGDAGACTCRGRQDFSFSCCIVRCTATQAM